MSLTWYLCTLTCVCVCGLNSLGLALVEYAHVTCNICTIVLLMVGCQSNCYFNSLNNWKFNCINMVLVGCGVNGLLMECFGQASQEGAMRLLAGIDE